MNVNELKERLIAQINSIDDEDLLYTIARIVNLELNPDEVYEMSPGEIQAVEEGLAQLDNGQWISHEEANRRIDEWLKK